MDETQSKRARSMDAVSTLLSDLLSSFPATLISLIMDYLVLFLNGTLFSQWGSTGNGPCQFELPCGLATDNKNIFVSEVGNHRIQAFSRTGQLLSVWGRYGKEIGEFDIPRCITIYQSRLYVADYFNSRVQVFGLQGRFTRQFLCGATCYGIAIAHDLVYISFPSNGNIGVFTLEGMPLGTIGRRGTGKGELLSPRGIDVATGLLCIADCGNHRVVIFSRDGIFRTHFGTRGDKTHQFLFPDSVKIDGAFLYVSDNHYIRLFDTKGNYLKRWGGKEILRDARSFVLLDHLCYIADVGHMKIKILA